MAARPPRRLVRLVLLLRVCWLLPVTLMALAYAGYTLAHLARLGRALAPGGGFPAAAVLESLFGAALGAAFLYFTWRMWRKTWDMVVDRIYPEPAAVYWQAAWIVLAVLLPLLVVWPKVAQLEGIISSLGR